MKAEKIIYLTGAPGLLADPDDATSLIHRLTAAEARNRIDDESVTGGMIPKLLACAEAVEGGQSHNSVTSPSSALSRMDHLRCKVSAVGSPHRPAAPKPTPAMRGRSPGGR